MSGGKEMFIVIEGDNGSGKTTIAENIMKLGYFFVTEDDKAKITEIEAKKLEKGSQERYEAFLAYNELCGSYATKVDNILLVRYWISTVSAAYADGLYTLEEALKEAEEKERLMPRPDYVFRLYCDYEERISRVKKRNVKIDNCSDDISRERDEKYREILDVLERKLNYMYMIDVTNMSPEKIVEKMFLFIGGKG